MNALAALIVPCLLLTMPARGEEVASATSFPLFDVAKACGDATLDAHQRAFCNTENQRWYNLSRYLWPHASALTRKQCAGGEEALIARGAREILPYQRFGVCVLERYDRDEYALGKTFHY